MYKYKLLWCLVKLLKRISLAINRQKLISKLASIKWEIKQFHEIMTKK